MSEKSRAAIRARELSKRPPRPAPEPPKKARKPEPVVVPDPVNVEAEVLDDETTEDA